MVYVCMLQIRQGMTALVGSLAAEVTPSAPLEGRRIRVPGTCRGLQPLDYFRRVRRRLAGQCAPGEDALDGLGHVQPGPTQWGVQRHDAVFEQPDDELGRQVPSQI